MKKASGDKDGTWLIRSRYADGDVPYANLNDDKFNVNNVNPGNENDNWRVREKFLPLTSR